MGEFVPLSLWGVYHELDIVSGFGTTSVNKAGRQHPSYAAYNTFLRQ